MARGTYGKLYQLNGQYYFLKQLERMYGICAMTIKHRIEVQHMTVEQAVTIPIQDQQGEKHKYHGELMSIKEIAECVGITENALRYRIKKHQMTAEQAADMPKDRRGRSRASGKYTPKEIQIGCKYPDCFHCVFNDCIVD